MTDYAAEDAAALRQELASLRARQEILADALVAAEEEVEKLIVLRQALERISEAQPATLEKLRRNNVVFIDIGSDPENWQHVAFSIYTDLCEVDTIARGALA